MVYGNAPVRWISIISRALADNLKEEVVETYGGKIISFLIVPIKEYGYVNLYGRDITRAELIDRAKTEFVSLASHQLRTPLASISLASELLLRGVGGEVEGRQKKYLEEIYGSTQRMTDLINALLNISRIELGTFVLKTEPLDLVKIIESILNELALQINGKKLDLKTNFEKVPIIEFDHNVFRIIVENLITNAIRYSQAGSPIMVSLEHDGSFIRLIVSDKGCGIPEAARDKIFDKLFRAENAKEMNRDGTGLGLYIVKSVAEKAGAKIRFESRDGEGTTFYVSIPIKKDVILP
jgi:two-component system phosphate regulon sensor histidine kinase PhoR